MKASLIINLVTAHNSGNEAQFAKALADLIHDEEKKGNAGLALTLMKAYANGKRPGTNHSTSPISTMSYAVQSATNLPKDKDSTLELLEILEPTISLSDVALAQKTKSTLQQIIEEQKRHDILLKSGIIPTNRILLCGPPGCGKTMTANALAKELGLPIAYVRLDGLVSSYLGQTGTNMRKIFEYTKGKRIMLLLDEFDAIAKKRDDTQDLGELKRVVTTLLQNLDSMQTQTFLVAATNHHHLLDPAIWRRFDITILLELPNEQQREQIITNAIATYLHNYTIVDSQKLVLLTEGMSGAQMQSFLQSLGKYCVMNKNHGEIIDVEEIGKIWLQHTALYVSEESDAYLTALLKLQKHGIPLRTLAAITGIPKSTLAYRINKEEKTYE